VVELVDREHQLASVDFAGVRRTVNVGLLQAAGPAVEPGDWVLVHVGFALSRVDEAEALATRRLLEAMGAAYEQELAELEKSAVD
jgi:hydrogenase expression/formation protein HypC